ncbi:MAG: ATP-binding protein [Candidatus Kapabacteria bacterium]|jgi:signal transduction histidine kinase/ligand-binding sensor domain-containing protein|nr:ATP-binding protein [Candidatus Kapabacteria bacterium]
MHVLVIVISLLLLYAEPASGQGAYSPQIAFKHLTIDNGLPQNTVFSIAQDHHGFMWFGTQDGLCRYDGYEMKVFRHDRKKPYSLLNNYVLSMLIDSKQRLWVGTAGGGLSLYNEKNNHFTPFVHNPHVAQTLSDNRIYALCEDRTGKLWVGTERGGINLFNPETGKARAFLHNPSDIHSIPANRVAAIVKDAAKTLWIATVGGGLCYFNPTDSTFIRVRFEANDAMATHGIVKTQDRAEKAGKPLLAIDNNSVSALYADSEGYLWVGTHGAGVLRVNVRHNTWERVVSNFSGKQLRPENDVFSIVGDQNGRIWIGLEGGGVRIYDRLGGIILSCVHDPLNAPSLSDNVVRRMYCDNAGTMWIGTATGGVNKYASGAHRFSVYRHEPLNPGSLAADVVRAFCEDAAGNIWVGAVDGGLNRFLRKEGTFERHQYAPLHDKALGSEDVWALAAAPDGELWVGTQNGLFAYHPTTKTRTVYRHSPSEAGSITNNIIRALHFDRDGVLWVGTNLGGLCRFDAASRSFKSYRFLFNDSLTTTGAGTVSDPIRDILHASDGTLWVGTVNLGVLAFDKERGVIKASYRHNEAAPEGQKGLSNNTIRYLHEDKRGNIWAGTLDGLNCISPQTGAIRVYTEDDGLPNEVIYGILEDNGGFFWLTTNKGLVRFHPEKRSFKTYTKQDGLQSNEFNGRAVMRGSDGWFYMGGIGGFNTFHPDSIRDNGRIPPVVLTDIKVFGRSLELDTTITERTTLTLPYTHSNCTFSFVALNFVGAEKNQYRYILEGFDKEWVEAGTRREAIYTNLEPGDYTFRVQGSNNDGIWNMEGAVLTITITPPWWGTWYFRLGAVAGVIAFGVFTYRRRIFVYRENERRLENLVQMRTQVLTETNNRLGAANEEIQRQMMMQHEQSHELQKAYMQLDEANDILITRNHELMQLNKEKNDLLAIVSHDLRNPLVSTLLAIKLLQKRYPNLSDEEKFAYLAKIQSASEQMIDFITKLLDVNALETGKMPVSLVPCDIRVATEAIMENYHPRAVAKGITFSYEAASEPIALADAVLLPQVLDNLLSNALKYSPNDKVIAVRITTRSANNVENTNDGKTVRLEVQDQGPGLTEEDKRRLFQKFARLSARPTGGEHSTGLGLSIVKKMVEAMHGKVWCESEIGVGSTFVVELPAFQSANQSVNHFGNTYIGYAALMNSEQHKYTLH